MLDITLKFLTDQLNTYLASRTGSTTPVVKMSKVVDETGKYAIESDSIGVTIINIEEERHLKSHLPDYTYLNGQHIVLEPDLKLNLHILFAANFRFYDQALKFISHLLIYFQAHSGFTSDEYFALDPRIEKLTVELQSLSYEQINQVWAFVGAKQLPSVVYKVRMVVLQSEAQSEIQPPLTEISINLHSH